MRKSVALLLLLLLVVGASTLSFAAGLGVGWYARHPAPSLALSPSPTLPAAQAVKETSRPDPADSRLALFWEAWELISRDFYSPDPVDDQQMNYEAVRGLIRGLKDPYTSFIEPASHQLEKASYEGKFGGIGALISMNDKQEPVIAEVYKGNPADVAGVLAGDIILTVDGQPVTGLAVEQVVAKIRGPVDSTVTLTLRRSGEEQPREIAMVRAEIKQPTVSWEALDEGRVAYIQLTFFAEPTGNELVQALAEARAAHIGEVILDLRGNRGGLLSAAGEVASQFIKEGALLYERQRTADGVEIEEPYMIPHASVLWAKEPLVVLMDKGTASASEIVAGAIQDYKRGVLLGETSYGKGSVQYLHELSDNSSLHVTAANWITPLKRRIHGIGLTPDVAVQRSEEDLKAGRDPQLEGAIEYLKSKR